MQPLFDPLDTSNSLRHWQAETESFRALLVALDMALQLDCTDTDRWRKLGHVRFVTSIAQKFLERLFVVEECEHLSELQQHHEYQHRVKDLQAEHAALRSEMSRAMFGLDRACGANKPACDQAFKELRHVVQHIQQHTRKEEELLQDSCNLDVGGEA